MCIRDRDKILFIADYIEPRRDQADNLPAMRRLAFVDLDEALFHILNGMLAYLNRSGGYIAPMTQETYEYYPVSYTHLDVYKRQVLEFSTWATLLQSA